jgi:hypothetical protein
MRQLILHIGPHKTGSTYIQERLFDNSVALATLGIDYPNIGILESNHHDIAELALKENVPALQDLLAPLRHSSAETILLSSENFDRLNCGQVKLLLAALPPERQVRVIYFVRDRTDLLVSSWQESVKHGCLLSFHEFAGPHLSHPFSSSLLNHGLILGAFASHLGKETISVLNYEEALGEGDIFATFGAACGLSKMTTVGRKYFTNNSFPLWEVEVIRALNAMAHREGRLHLANVREAWATSKLLWPVEAERLKSLETRILSNVAAFSISGSFIELALEQAFVDSFGSCVVTAHDPSHRRSVRTVPLSAWMMDDEAREVMDRIYKLVRRQLTMPT